MKICSVGGCNSEVIKGSLCNPHKWRRNRYRYHNAPAAKCCEYPGCGEARLSNIDYCRLHRPKAAKPASDKRPHWSKYPVNVYNDGITAFTPKQLAAIREKELI